MALLDERRSKDIACLYVVRFYFQEFTIVDHRVLQPPLLKKGLCEVVMSRAVFGSEIDSCLQPGNGLVELAFLQENYAEVVLRYVVVFRDSKRMSKQRLAITPIRRLHPGAPA